MSVINSLVSVDKIIKLSEVLEMEINELYNNTVCSACEEDMRFQWFEAHDLPLIRDSLDRIKNISIDKGNGAIFVDKEY